MTVDCFKLRVIDDWPLYRVPNSVFVYNNNKECRLGKFKWVALTGCDLDQPLLSSDPMGDSLSSASFVSFVDEARTLEAEHIEGVSFLTVDHLTFGNMFHSVFDHLYRAWLLQSSDIEVHNMLFLASTWDWAKLIINHFLPASIRLYFIDPTRAYSLATSMFFSNTFAFANAFAHEQKPWNSHRLRPYNCHFTADLQRCVNTIVNSAQTEYNFKYHSPFLFVSRLSTKTRAFSNQSEIELIFSRYGFEIIYLERLSPIEQLMSFKGRSHIAGLHGAGMTNLIAADPATSIMEIFATVTNRCYEFVAIACGLPYKAVFSNCDSGIMECDVRMLTAEVAMFINHNGS